jgi:hypothetical protein
LTTYSYLVGLSQSIEDDAHVHGIIGGAENLETMASDLMLNDFKIVQLHTRAQDVDFGDGTKYKYKARKYL